MVKNLDFLALLSKIETLKWLDLVANPITEISNYKQNLFEKVPHLEILDGYSKDGQKHSLENVQNFDKYQDKSVDNEFSKENFQD